MNVRTRPETGRKGNPPATIQALFWQQAQRTPHAVALLDGQQQVSYAELAQAAAGVAAVLRSHGAGPGAIVAVCAERSAALVAGLLGCLMTGAAYLPLDPAYPLARLAFMLEDSQARLLLTQHELADRLPAFTGGTVYLEDVMPPTGAPDLQNNLLAGAVDDPDPAHDDAAYVIYTSGSTGRPKGVVGLHRGAVNRLRWMFEQFPYTPEDVGVHKTALSFVDSVAEIFGPLLAGVPAVLLPQAVTQDGRALVQALHAGRVTRIVLVPSLLRALLDAYPDLQQRLPHLTLWVCSGEALPVELARRFRQQMPHARLLNFYGSSEVSADVTWYDTAELPAEAASVPIGRPMANTQVYVLDEAGEQVPAGAAGEIYIAGEHLAAGYLHQPAMTAQRFPTLPIAGRGPVRLYATGDRGRWLPDGNLEYLGRRDDQVKVRGVRIELGEVRTALAAHPAAAQVEVVARELAGSVELVAYYVLRPGADVTVHDLRTFAAGRLPEQMLPAAFVLLPAMPLTPNGKIDRLQLPPPSAPAAAGGSAAPDAARSEVEAKLIKLWETVLQRHPAGVHDSFFDLGGHSLAAMRLFVLIEQEFGVSLPLASLFGAATVAQLARLIESHRQPSKWQALVAVQPLGSRPPLYIVHGITGDVLWFRDLGRHLAPDQPLFGLQAPALDHLQEPFESLAAMAASYLAEIRAHQPSGPYYLGGASFGGTVALEMAHQLMAQGEAVALLVQFDHAPPAEAEDDRWGRRARQAARALRNAPRWLANLREMESGALAARARRKLNNGWQELTQVTRATAARPVQAADLIDYADQLPQHRQRLIESHHHAAAAYTPRPYPGRVLLLLAQVQPLFSTSDPVAQWRRLAGDQLQVRTVPGSHEGIFREPHVRQLAHHIRQAMEQG